jgi:cysteinyl-tRNA synthetase
MYTCGPSIYLLPHIGNYCTFLYEDILNRYLEYLGYRVERVLNVTDVEDKAIAEAEKEGKTLKRLTERNTKIFLDELQKLGAKMPTRFPKSSTSVEQAVSIIQTLLKKGCAYWYDGNVYFDPLKFKDFGKLYGMDMKRWPKEKRRFHKDTYPGNRWNLGDFILWHSYREGDKVYWDTSLGRGRPAWNVQDPAMVSQALGYKVDVYCGGVDNLVRHHDYVKAVMESLTGEQFARYWLHGEHLFV